MKFIDSLCDLKEARGNLLLDIPEDLVRVVKEKNKLPEIIKFKTQGFDIKLCYSRILEGEDKERICVNEFLQCYQNEFESICMLTDVLFELNKKGMAMDFRVPLAFMVDYNGF